MEKVSRKQRKEIYWKIYRLAYKEMKTGDSTFICNELAFTLNNMGIDANNSNCVEHFPEFKLVFGRQTVPYRSNDIRLIVLGFCIAMCDTKEFAA